MSSVVKDRNGVDTTKGDMVFFLRGTVGDTYYQTVGEVVEVHPRQRIVKLDTGDLLYWHEFWQERD